ncbi:MAG: hypothetical protein JW772_00230 [Candidatus Diapherotrites archaeon]|nr:hypothetical protein [Candidatus Diapherotrites archaeon]
MPNNFRLVHTRELSSMLRAQVVAVFSKHISNSAALNTFLSNGGKITGIARGNILIGFCAFVSPDSKSILINHIWSNTRSQEARDFKTIFGATPAEYLLSNFMTHGISRFHYTGFTPSGRQMIRRLVRNGILAKKSLGYAPTPLALKKGQALRKLRVLH